MSAEIYKKLAKARHVVEPVTKSQTADTGKYEYNYSTLGDVMQSVDKALEQFGLTWIAEIEAVGEQWQMITVFIDDETGDTLRVGGPTGTAKNDPQAMGSTISYYRRYALVTAMGLNQLDDDGGIAHRAVTKPGQRTPAEKEVRDIVNGLPDSMAKEDFQEDFKAEFGSGLSQLPESKHGDALGWAKQWLKDRTPSKKKAAAKKAAAQ